MITYLNYQCNNNKFENFKLTYCEYSGRIGAEKEQKKKKQN